MVISKATSIILTYSSTYIRMINKKINLRIWPCPLEDINSDFIVWLQPWVNIYFVTITICKEFSCSF